VLALDGLQVDEAADGQPLFVPLTAVHHSVICWVRTFLACTITD
jgi:hypothetical protein